jgi:hypothetical protein
MTKKSFKHTCGIVTNILILLTFTTLAGCIYLSEPEFISDTPEYYRTDYNTVWRAAVDTLGELGFVIVQMNKSEGYISTDRMEKNERRVKVSLRFSVSSKFVKVRIISSSEMLHISETTNDAKWLDHPTYGHVIQDKIKRKMKSKLQPYWVSSPEN